MSDALVLKIKIADAEVYPSFCCRLCSVTACARMEGSIDGLAGLSVSAEAMFDTMLRTMDPRDPARPLPWISSWLCGVCWECIEGGYRHNRNDPESSQFRSDESAGEAVATPYDSFETIEGSCSEMEGFFGRRDSLVERRVKMVNAGRVRETDRGNHPSVLFGQGYSAKLYGWYRSIAEYPPSNRPL